MRVARPRNRTTQAGRSYQRQTGTTAERGYDSAWQKMRLAYLAYHPLCVECERLGDLKPAQDVDHVIAFNGPHDPLRLDWTNLQGLCRRCHNAKTHG